MVRAPLFVPIYFNKMPFYNKRFLSGNPDMLYWKGAEEKQAGVSEATDIYIKNEPEKERWTNENSSL